jgi:hypothetical protein
VEHYHSCDRGVVESGARSDEEEPQEVDHQLGMTVRTIDAVYIGTSPVTKLPVRKIRKISRVQTAGR